MRIIEYNNGLEFLNENEKILIEREAVSQLLLFNAMKNKETAKSSECFFGKVIDDNGEVCFLFNNIKSFNCIIYVPKEVTNKEAYDIFVCYLIVNNYEINGVNSNEKTCKEFCDAYRDKLGAVVFKKHLAMDIMELRHLNNISLANGSFRVATKKDIPLILKWVIEFCKETGAIMNSYEDIRENIKEYVKNGAFYLFDNEARKTVSMVATTRKLINGTSIAYVYTPSELRGKSYATTIMYYLGKKLLSEGNEFCCLFVDKNNPISNIVYKKIGYIILEDNYDYRIVK